MTETLESTPAVIREIMASDDLEPTVNVIRQAFQTVATEFGLTETNCPGNPAFIKRAGLEGLLQKGVKLYGLFAGDRQIGCVAIEKSNDTLYFMEKLAVLPDCRHRNNGRQLMDFVFDNVKKAGGQKVSIAIVDENIRLKDWYKAYGFVETGTKKFEHLPFTVGFLEKSAG